MSTWKQAESRIGVWLGAKGIGNSGRSPLSGGNSGETHSDNPHPTIFNECKRAKNYLTVCKYWVEKNSSNKERRPVDRIPTIISLPTVDGLKVVAKSSDIWCFHNSDIEKIVSALSGNGSYNLYEWRGAFPAALSLYNKTINIWKSSRLPSDRTKQMATVSLVYHGHIGFWLIMNRYEICKFWDLVLKARIERERKILEEQSLDKGA